MRSGDDEHRPDEREDVAEAAVGPDRAVDAEHQVRGDVDEGDEREHAEHELGVLAGHFGIEAEQERGGVGDRRRR